jgi:glycosyltransferase involved in cell wall biosynthesis
LTEGLPNSVLEAMACGLPVVVSACGGVAEAVMDGIDGFVVPLRGVTQAADALQALYEDEALRLRMGYAARERVRSGFALERLLDDLMTIYGAVCGGVTRSSLPPAVARTAQLRLLSVGPLSWTQGVDDAMHAVSIARGRGVDCRLRIFGDGPYLNALWFVRRQLELERHVELRSDEPLSRVIKPASLGASGSAASLLACPQWARQLEWADVLLDSALRDPSVAAIDAARAAGVEVISSSGDPEAIAAALIAIAATRGPSRPRRASVASATG